MSQKLQNSIAFSFTLIFFLTFFPGIKSYSSTTDKNGNWSFSVGTGISILSREFSKDLVLLDNEFQHQPGWALDINIGRTLGNHWEPNLRLGLFNLYGESNSPDFSAVGQHFSLSGVIYLLPVQYATNGGSVSGIMRYYIKSFSNKKRTGFYFNPFLEAGAGTNFFSTELRYKNPPPDPSKTVIFDKGVNSKETTANIAQYTFGLGTKLGDPRKMHFVISYNFDIVNYACLDAVHNYTGAERNHARGIISKFMAGVVIPLGRGNSSENSYLPWSP
ncbi:hypothetical protein SAMN05444274_107214 [Mariniphaga anaerophila]|uniref:Outer membrane protein beta-barrel domain-containing protein n=1 Tax=Mariniphaga anaerophila TaxID=1484053 RepID=A0A1M5DRC3_9BACT|nr:hypothetical protein [Mariniphaga anaerophila]SHF69466.1 hypothetical protein SAMN05444274_107214 [Mariniphaga anaerophila]